LRIRLSEFFTDSKNSGRVGPLRIKEWLHGFPESATESATVSADHLPQQGKKLLVIDMIPYVTPYDLPEHSMGF
jgi:hypothetical protein